MTASPKRDVAAAGRITDVTRRRLLEGLSRVCGPVPSGRREFLVPQHTFWSGTTLAAAGQIQLAAETPLAFTANPTEPAGNGQ